MQEKKGIFKSEDNFFINNEIGLVSKDGSLINSNNDTFKNNQIDIASFIKKVFYASPEILLENTSITTYLIEYGSNIKGVDSVQYSSNVEEKLYGNLYGRASD